MDMLQAVIQGLIQGLAEFLPISSSGHLILASSIYKSILGKDLVSGGHQEVFFDIMLHLGTLVAVMVYFRADIINLLTNFFISIKTRSVKSNEESKFFLNVIVGTIATIAVFYPFRDLAETLVQKPAYAGVALLIAGTVLFSTEFVSNRFDKKNQHCRLEKSNSNRYSPGACRYIPRAFPFGLDYFNRTGNRDEQGNCCTVFISSEHPYNSACSCF